MAERILTPARVSPEPVAPGYTKSLRVRYRLMPWWARVFAIWVVSRVITTAIMLAFANAQAANAWTGARPSYLAFAQLWDSNWYHIVAVVGYPSVLPLTSDGHVGQNAWAFMPAYPWLVRVFMTVTTLPWEPVSVAMSLLFSLASALMIYRLMKLVLPAGSALFTVALFCIAPLSPILQVSYAESMQIFLLALALYLLVKRRYGWLFPVVLVMSLTRPTGLAFALALGLHVVHRVRTRKVDALPRGELVASVALTLFSVLAGYSWSLIAWGVTGSPSAYTDTELAWRADYIGYQPLVPFAGWFQAAGFWGSFWRIGGVAVVLLVLVILAFAVAQLLPSVRRLGPDLRFWIIGYSVYLLAVFFPQSSTFRLLLPLFPLLGALAQPRSRAWKAALVVVGLAGQALWIYVCWWVNGYDWSPP